jgi:hypothetical protein
MRTTIIPEVGIPAAVVFGLACCTLGCRSAVDHSYRHEYATVLDNAELIANGKVDESNILPRLEAFVDRDCQGKALARLTVSPYDSDLVLGTNPVMMPEADPDKVISAGWVRFDFGRPEVAQVWCFGGDATAFLRTKTGVIRRQLKGKRSARDPIVNGTTVHLIGLRVGASSTQLYCHATELPTLGEAQSLHHALEELIGADVSLILRTDPFFYEEGGPLWDIFSVPLPKGSAVGYLNRHHIECPPSSDSHRCEARDSWIPSYLQ